MTAPRPADEPEKPRRQIKLSLRVRISIAIGALVVGVLVVWGVTPDDDEDDDDRQQRTEQVERDDLDDED